MSRFWKPFTLRLLDLALSGTLLALAVHSLLTDGWTWPLGIAASVLAVAYLCKALYLAAGLAGYVSIRVRVKQRLKGYQSNGRNSYHHENTQR